MSKQALLKVWLIDDAVVLAYDKEEAISLARNELDPCAMYQAEVKFLMLATGLGASRLGDAVPAEG